MVKPRSDVEQKDCWNVEALYPSLQAWQEEFDRHLDLNKSPQWPQILAYQGKLNEGPTVLAQALKATFDTDRLLSKLYTYAHLRFDEDITNNEHKIAYNKILSAFHQFGLETAWLEPEILALDQALLDSYLKANELAEYRFHLEKLIRMKPHTLAPEQEELMARAGKALQTSYKTFSAINDADFKFNKIKDAVGKEHDLSHGLFGLHMRSQDRVLRKNTFLSYHAKYQSYENTLCELLNGQVQNHVFNAQARKFNSSLEAALYPKNIDPSVYHALIEAVHNRIGVLHDYMNLRKQVLDVEHLHLYDMYVPLTGQVDIRLSYEEAADLIIESVAPLGSEYQSLLKDGLFNQRWVDRYENQNKRSGAYSSGCYDSMPYILMNYKGIIRDVFTLAHEAGHSMHSLLTHKHQPYQYGNYPIFVAEVASTFNEDLLMRLMLERANSKEEKIFLLNQKIEDIRATLFRQTMFAEFELWLHEMGEKNEPLTPENLKKAYLELNRFYFGPQVLIDEEAEMEWARIPHFYYNFYVYQYATGISAALALADGVVNGGDEKREAYLNFLKSGSSRYPIETLKLAGVDVKSPEPVEAAIQKFGGLVRELSDLLKT